MLLDVSVTASSFSIDLHGFMSAVLISSQQEVQQSLFAAPVEVNNQSCDVLPTSISSTRLRRSGLEMCWAPQDDIGKTEASVPVTKVCIDICEIQHVCTTMALLPHL